MYLLIYTSISSLKLFHVIGCNPAALSGRQSVLIVISQNHHLIFIETETPIDLCTLGPILLILKSVLLLLLSRLDKNSSEGLNVIALLLESNWIPASEQMRLRGATCRVHLECKRRVIILQRGRVTGPTAEHTRVQLHPWRLIHQASCIQRLVV